MQALKIPWKLRPDANCGHPLRDLLACGHGASRALSPDLIERVALPESGDYPGGVRALVKRLVRDFDFDFATD